MVIFHSYVTNYQRVNPIHNPIKPPFSYGFPMVSLWFPYGFVGKHASTTVRIWLWTHIPSVGVRTLMARRLSIRPAGMVMQGPRPAWERSGELVGFPGT